MYLQKKIGVYVSYRGKLLLIREKSEGRRDYRWNIVKGTVEAKDGSYMNTVKRECREEVGLRVKNIRTMNISYRRRRLNPVIQVNVFADSPSGKPKLASKMKQKALNEDIIAAIFFTPKDLLKIPRRELMNERVWRGIRRWVIAQKLMTPLEVDNILTQDNYRNG